ncbi:MAG: chemotaxis protein CheY [Acidithiobacillales bacterium SG8_45]|jgi:DNA-binding response OmpR family regulator|nr:MAG: chemotaxis protein CheY [Acidithiobacillales bacterium SG8_45]
MTANRILLADDDVELCEMLAEYLERDGFRVSLAHDGESALREAQSGIHDLVVLDIMMPGMTGLDVLRELREESLIPVLILTARGDDVDSVVGLELGADDYLAKPCNPRVLVARIRAILRRAENHPGQNDASSTGAPLVVEEVELFRGSRKVLRDGKPVPMTSTEFGVLEALMKRAGHVISKAELSSQVLGRELSRYDRSLDMHVSNLRKKLGSRADGDERIKTVRGVGYLYTIDENE